MLKTGDVICRIIQKEFKFGLHYAFLSLCIIDAKEAGAFTGTSCCWYNSLSAARNMSAWSSIACSSKHLAWTLSTSDLIQHNLNCGCDAVHRIRWSLASNGPKGLSISSSTASARGPVNLNVDLIAVRCVRSELIVGRRTPIKHWFSACSVSKAMATGCITLMCLHSQSTHMEK